MKVTASLIFCLLLSTLLIGPTSVHATEAATPTQPEPEFNLFFVHPLDMNVNAYSHTEVDSAGGIHTAFVSAGEVFYAYCPADCGGVGDWSLVNVSHDYEPFYMHPSLQLDPNDRPRILVNVMDSEFMYAECSGNCTQESGWKKVDVQIGDEAVFDHYFALTAGGWPRFVAPATGGFRYDFCNENCTLEENWDSVLVDLKTDLTALQLNLTPTGDKPRVTGLKDGQTLVYLECDANCETDGEWNGLVLYEMESSYSFRLNAQGKPRLAFYVPDEADTKIYYAWNNGNPLTGGEWDNYARNLPTNREAVDMILDGQGKPRIAYVSDLAGLSYTECTGNCEAMSATWQDQSIETAAELDVTVPLAPDTDCVLDGWQMGKWISLALDGSDRPHVSYFVSNYETCPVEPTSRVKGYAIRFAKVGGVTEPPTAPESISIECGGFGTVEEPFSITARVTPASAATPITYEWTATGMAPQTHTTSSLSDTVSFTWPADAVGRKTVQVKVSNALGSVTLSREVNILETPVEELEWVYLPLLR